MKLLNILEEKRAHSLAAACLREVLQVEPGLKTAAAEKGAGFADRVGKLIEMVKAPFRSTTDILREGAKNTMLESLHTLIKGVPHDVDAQRRWMTESTIQKLETQVTKILGGGEKVVETKIQQVIEPPAGLKQMEQISKLRDALKDDGKLPMKAMLGLAGAFGLGATAMSEVDRLSTDKAHRDNMILIMRDSSIPLGLKPRAKEMYEILVRYAPSIAKDPVFSKDFTKNLIRHDAVDHKVVSDLVSAEKTYQESKGRRSEFLQGIGSLALKAGGI